MPPYQQQPGLIEQSLHIKANQAYSGRAFTPTPSRPHQAEPPHQCYPTLINTKPGLIGQSLYTNAYQASLSRASIPTATRPHQAQLHADAKQALSGRAPHHRQPGLIRQSSTPTPTRPFQAEHYRRHRQNSTPTPIRHHWAEPLLRHQSGLLGLHFWYSCWRGSP